MSEKLSSKTRPTLVLLDANSLFYRAFHALPLTLTTRDGQVTNAVYGFTSMFIKLLERIGRPAAIAAVFDKGLSGRGEIFPEYKAQRPETPVELKQQQPLVREVLRALSVPVVEVEGYEADDVIATFATRGEAEGWEVMVVTSDRDAYQLVSPHIKIMTNRKGISDIVIYDEDKLAERYDLRPDQMVEMAALRGDPSDNIPGVPGVGEKTAIKLIKEYGTVEQIIAAAPNIKQNKLRENLIAHSDGAILGKELVTLQRDVPIGTDVDGLKWGPWDDVQVKQVFQSFEFRTLYQQLMNVAHGMSGQSGANVAEASQPKPVKAPPVTAITDDNLPALAKKWEKSGSPDLGLEMMVDESGALTTVLLSDGKDSWSLALDPNALFESLDGLSALGRSYQGRLVLEDAKAAIRKLRSRGVRMDCRVFDVGLAGYLVEPTVNDYTLSRLAADYLERTIPDSPVVKVETELLPEVDTETGEASPGEVMSARAASLADLVPELEKILAERDQIELLENMELPLMRALVDVEDRGVAIDREYIQELSRQLGTRIAELTTAILEDAGEEFNINSPQQLQEILFTKLGLKPGKKTKTGFATDASTLSLLVDDHPIVAKIMDYRELTKLNGTYLEPLPTLVDPITGRVHTTFNQKVAATGRLSSKDPNLQNIPIRTPLGKQLRKAFVPGKGYDGLLVADYSQVELRILAHLSKDEIMTESFLTGDDVHARTAAEVFGVPREEVTSEMRSRAKAVNFGIVYGISAKGLSDQLRIPIGEAQVYIDRYFERYKGVKEYIDSAIAAGHRDGYVTTLFGRRRYLPEIASPNFRMRTFGERLAVNMPIQGTAADIIKVAMVDLEDSLKAAAMKSRVVLQVHDELVLEIVDSERDEASRFVKEAMVGAFELKPPLEIDMSVGTDWYSAK